MSHFLKSIFQQRIPFIYLLLPFILLRPFPHSALSLPLPARSYPAASSSVSYSPQPALANILFPNAEPCSVSKFCTGSDRISDRIRPHALLLPSPQSFVFFGPALFPCAASRQPFRAKAAPFITALLLSPLVVTLSPINAPFAVTSFTGYALPSGRAKKSLRSPSPSLSLFHPPRNSLSLKSLPVPISATMPPKQTALLASSIYTHANGGSFASRYFPGEIADLFLFLISTPISPPFPNVLYQKKKESFPLLILPSFVIRKTDKNLCLRFSRDKAPYPPDRTPR